MDDHTQNEARATRNTALMGLAIAVVWLAIVATISYSLVPKK